MPRLRKRNILDQARRWLRSRGASTRFIDVLEGEASLEFFTSTSLGGSPALYSPTTNNVYIDPASMGRDGQFSTWDMPVLIHELYHAYHDQVIPEAPLLTGGSDPLHLTGAASRAWRHHGTEVADELAGNYLQEVGRVLNDLYARGPILRSASDAQDIWNKILGRRGRTVNLPVNPYEDIAGTYVIPEEYARGLRQAIFKRGDEVTDWPEHMKIWPRRFPRETGRQIFEGEVQRIRRETRSPRVRRVNWQYRTPPGRIGEWEIQVFHPLVPLRNEKELHGTVRTMMQRYLGLWAHGHRGVVRRGD